MNPSVRRQVARAALALLLGGCHEAREERTRADFFPLHPDDTWVYEVGRPMRNVVQRMTVRVRAAQYVEPLGRACQIVDESYSGQTSTAPETYPVAYCREGDFLHRALSLEYRDGQLVENGLGSAEEQFLPVSLEAARGWESRTQAYPLGPRGDYHVRQTHRVLTEREEVSVPAGRFSGCIRVDTVAVHGGGDPPDASATVVLYYSDWYAPNVGLVRTVQHSRSDGGPRLAQLELLTYDVAGAR